MAKRKSRKRARRSGGSFNFSKPRRKFRRRSGGGGSRSLGGFVDTSLLTGGAAGVAGYVGVSWLMSKVPAGWIDSDAKRVGVKLAASLLGAFVLRKAGLGRFAAGVATGGVIAAGVDAARMARVPGLNGLGEFGLDAVSGLDYIGGAPISQLPAGDGVAGLGGVMADGDDDEEIVIYQEQ